MAKQSFTIKRARAHSKAAPRKAGFAKAGYGGGKTSYGSAAEKRNLFKPGQRTRQTGPESGRNG